MNAAAEKNNWDWEPGRRPVADLGAWKERFEQVHEPAVSPDGERIAAPVKTGEMEYGLCQNGELWENTFDKVWYLRYAPDGRVTALVSDTGEWTLAVDGETWENRFEFAWDTRFSDEGRSISITAQSGRKYFVVTDDTPWPEGFDNLTGMTPSPEGNHVAAAVQVVPFGEGEIFKFQEGCYSVAVDGRSWDAKFVNVWEMSFSPDGSSVAAEVRVNLYDYTIAVDGKRWEQRFDSVWRPLFSPVDGSVTAPARVGGKWTLVKDGVPLWKGGYAQLWHHMYSPDGKRLAAIVAPKYGRWTMAVEDRPWDLTFGDLVTDPVFSPDGLRVGCVGKENERWAVVVDGKAWNGRYDMAWRPVFSPDGRRVAAKVEEGGKYRILLDGGPVQGAEAYHAVWEPVFSPDGDRLLIRGIAGEAGKEQYVRHVIPLT